MAGPLALDFFVHYRYPGQGLRLDLSATGGVDEAHLPELAEMVLGEAVCGRVAQTQTPLAYADVDRSQDEHLALAATLGARSYASYPLLDGAELLGTLSFGSRTRTSLTEPELEILRLATDVLSTALAHHRDHVTLVRARTAVGWQQDRISELSEQVTQLRLQGEHLTAAVAGRDHIARTKGMLMLALGLTDDQAWQLLVRLSQTTNRKVRTVATLLADHLQHAEPLPDDLRRQLPAPIRGR